ncbi:hypothetical protein QA649_38575 [Bradyrhizobium sp. CB1717]|uniref:hypothetical protein n=1 Tax=Bradyrhizobium sp. CB1717 TaxID=3039154 RepID=UPI0024B2549B|nr:hypothetical protein [Bradyrhizobium sp. CB1717]WFU23848.1 hypothetical protein QA649_38575 [Bradyrhizobium sp. CB1717]
MAISTAPFTLGVHIARSDTARAAGHTCAEGQPILRRTIQDGLRWLLEDSIQKFAEQQSRAITVNNVDKPVCEENENRRTWHAFVGCPDSHALAR